jgi:hypothetical protein
VVFGMSLETYTLIHVVISLIGIVTGLIVLYGMLTRNRMDSWTAVFLNSTVATSVTGYGFPVEKLLPSHIVGFISLIVLVIAIVARYTYHLRSGWHRAYVITAVTALYLNVFVLVVQAFRRIPSLNALAPKQNEPPFAIAQGIVFLVFLVLGILAAMKFPRQDIVFTKSVA